ncbi:hypothetical protein IEO21_04427 [Rhodonia placenta]|uniref:Uncharacterized protein n=1 Tax=Rhodonia placenta TaxID=104341 RepID=A0A8H7P3T3_9APHY|nr:hypothetical protein IEO21_04427 [Postia placenta]
MPALRPPPGPHSLVFGVLTGQAISLADKCLERRLFYLPPTVRSCVPPTRISCKYMRAR